MDILIKDISDQNGLFSTKSGYFDTKNGHFSQKILDIFDQKWVF